MQDQGNQDPIPVPTPPVGQTSVKTNYFLIVILLATASIFILIVGFLVLQAKFIVQYPPSAPIISTRSNTNERCVEKSSLNCIDETELSFECSSDYQSWAEQNCLGWEPQEGQFCGGIVGTACPEGYMCEYDGNWPDAGGACTKLIEQSPSISGSELDAGWYDSPQDKKKANTPAGWIYTVSTEPGKSSCWHEPRVQCGYLPD